MRSALFCVVLASSVALAPIQAQSNPPRTDDEIEAAFMAHRGDFDYLLGDWHFTANSKEWGKFQGLWSAVRLATGDGSHILDEYRIVGDSGETFFVTATLRAYNAVLDRWELISVDRGGGLLDFGTAKMVGDEMHIEQVFGAAGERPERWRIRYYDIRPDGFSWTADRSLDEGKSWTRNHLQIEARRIGPARSLPALVSDRRPRG